MINSCYTKFKFTITHVFFEPTYSHVAILLFAVLICKIIKCITRNEKDVYSAFLIGLYFMSMPFCTSKADPYSKETQEFILSDKSF